MKTGYKTTEFWLGLVAMILGAVMASGAIEAGGLAAQILGGAIHILGLLGYTASRASVKKSADALTAAKHLAGLASEASGEVNPSTGLSQD